MIATVKELKEIFPDNTSEIAAVCIEQIKSIAKNSSEFFIFTDTQEVYMVNGIITSWEDMFFYRPLPILLKATLIPFRDKIISDGLVIPYNVCFGKGYSSEFKDIYMNAKKNKSIHFSL